MDGNNKEQFSANMYTLAEEFGGKISKDRLKMIFGALSEYTIDQFSAGCSWLIKNRVATFPAVPTTKEIIDAINTSVGVLDVTGRAELEADKVFKKLKEWGREALPLFYDDITKYLMTFRWTFAELADMKLDRVEWFRKEFVKAYINSAKQEKTFIETTEKAGLIPASNLKKLLK